MHVAQPDLSRRKVYSSVASAWIPAYYRKQCEAIKSSNWASAELGFSAPLHNPDARQYYI